MELDVALKIERSIRRVRALLFGHCALLVSAVVLLQLGAAHEIGRRAEQVAVLEHLYLSSGAPIYYSARQHDLRARYLKQRARVERAWILDRLISLRPALPAAHAIVIAEAVQECEQIHGLPVPLVLAVMWGESDFDVRAIGPANYTGRRAKGAMQVHPVWLPALGLSEAQLLEPATNIRAGCRILRHYIDRHDRLLTALNAYNGWADDANPYANDVLRRKGLLLATRREG